MITENGEEENTRIEFTIDCMHEDFTRGASFIFDELPDDAYAAYFKCGCCAMSHLRITLTPPHTRECADRLESKIAQILGANCQRGRRILNSGRFDQAPCRSQLTLSGLPFPMECAGGRGIRCAICQTAGEEYAKIYRCTVRQDAWIYKEIVLEASNAQEASELALHRWKQGEGEWTDHGAQGFDDADCEAEDCEELSNDEYPCKKDDTLPSTASTREGNQESNRQKQI